MWAIRSVNFPNDVDDARDDRVYNSESVIRLLTRLIFIWFIKEKKLVPDKLFNERELKSILKDFNPESDDKAIFYRAILQNLFFATLNTPMDKDAISDDEKRQFLIQTPIFPNENYLDQTRYRYKDYFIHPENALSFFANIPFGYNQPLNTLTADVIRHSEKICCLLPQFRYPGA